VGDAAGLIDPVSGDGMYECFVSSRLAAEAILSGRISAYPAALDAAVGRLHNASWKLKKALDRWPRASWRVARTQLLWRSVERLLLGDVAAPADVHGVARVPLRMLDALARF
jgi:flavin-dependent dehydrogenase